MNEQQARNLINRYRNGLCSSEEEVAIEKWMQEEYSSQSWDISPEDKALFGQTLKNKIDDLRDAPSKLLQLWPRMIAAAILLLTLSAGFFFYSKSFKSRQQLAREQIVPGKNIAFLVLASGKRISLNDTRNGQVLKQAGVTISKAADGHLVYTVDGSTSKNGSVDFNTIETPRGGQYQVNLADGTEVWLNSASSLKFPTSFRGLKDRNVELSGEAYFQVAKDKTKLFRVLDKKQIIEVLGTHFNVSDYADEPISTTTLLEGSIMISEVNTRTAPIVLKPNEQAKISSNGILVNIADTRDAIAWREGYFMFNNESLESILRKVGRWYNVEVEYTNKSSRKITFFGTVSRFNNISEVLKVLELTGEVRFDMKGNKLNVIEK